MPTTNLGALSVPTTGSEAGTWGSASVNPNMVALDGYGRGVQTISLSSATAFTLSAPSGSITPGAGPTQAQNAVLKFTGTQTGNAVITFPLPGFYIVKNSCPFSSFYIQGRGVGTGNIIAFPPGRAVKVWNDGANVEFCDVPDVGSYLDLATTNVPAWMLACSVFPYLICNGVTHTVSNYTSLGQLLGSTFGGNGVTTFAVPDLRGRYRIPLNQGAGRVTTAGSGVDGDTLGSAGGAQATSVLLSNLPNTTIPVTVTDNRSFVTNNALPPSAGGPFGLPGGGQLGLLAQQTVTFSGTISGAAALGSGVALPTLPPGQVAGITLIKT